MAVLDDLPFIMEVRKIIMREGAWKDRDSLEIDLEDEKSSVSIRMEDETMEVCLAFIGEIFIGMGALNTWECGSVAKGRSDLAIGYFYTVPEHRRQGVMHCIADILLQKAKEHGCVSTHIYAENEHRKALYEMGFRDVIEIDGGRVFVNGDGMEMTKDNRQESYCNLQPLRIPAGWSVVFNKFEDIEPENISNKEDEIWLISFKENILYMRSEIIRKLKGKTEKQTLEISLGWYPDGEPDGEFILQAVLDRDLYEPLLEFCSRSKADIVQTLEKWLFVEFMPMRFIEKETFRKNHMT